MRVNAEIKAILFDLDGTLLPLDQPYFIKKYFKAISAYAASKGIDTESFMSGMMAGTEEMIFNDGIVSNMDAFWNRFSQVVSFNTEELMPYLDSFYFDGFKALRKYTTDNPLAVQMIKEARKNGRKVVLATNPVFPMIAQLERLSWLGLSEGDFDLVTSYENSNFCKPNPKYYLEICDKIGIAPENCLMIGNDESDDMKGAHLAGMECFLVTDHRIISDNYVWTGERGSFEQALHMIERI